MTAGLWSTMKAAFNARPLGMPVPPNWIALAAVALLGVRQPGFWFLGAGLELAYLAALGSSPRFRRSVAAADRSAAFDAGRARVDAALAALPEDDRRRYADLERQCSSVLDRQIGADADDRIDQEGGLARLLWVFLRLLATRRAIEQALDEILWTELRDAPTPAASNGDRGCALLESRLAELRRRLGDASLADDLRRSLEAQAEILGQRLANRREGLGKLDVLEAELVRIEEQIKLIKEQTSVASDAAAVSERIDQIAAGLSGTAQWAREQHRLYGSTDLLDEPPPVPPARSGNRGRNIQDPSSSK
jgi:hypothetical protein